MKITWHMPTLRRTSCGLSIRALALARRLAAFGHSITFTVDREKTDIAGDHVTGMRLDTVQVEKRRPLHWCLQARARSGDAASFADRIDREHDLMISCQAEFVSAYAARPDRRPVLFVCGGTTLLHEAAEEAEQASISVVRRLPYAIDRRFKRRNEAHACAVADAVVFDSLHTRDRVAARYGLDARRLHTVYGGVDPAAFHPPDRRARLSARRRLDIPPDGIVVVWTGRFSPEKNLGLLLRAIEHCRRPPARVLLVGDGPTRRRLLEVARGLGAGDLVQFPGEQADVRPFLHAGDIFAFPSRGESFGGALAEAMACGLACVGLRPDGRGVRNANQELIDHGRSGWLVDRPEPAALAEALDTLAADADRRRALGEAAGLRARRDFTWPAGARRLNDLISKLMPLSATSDMHAGSVDSDEPVALGSLR